MSKFFRSGAAFKVAADAAMDMYDTLPVGNYIVKETPQGELYLEMIDAFAHTGKLYGNTTRHAERMINTFTSRDSSTGVLLNGEKGSGKSLLAKTLSIMCHQNGVPTITINAPFCGDKFNKFMQDISQPCMVLFDEFEKTYDKDDQEQVLTLLDGVFPAKKLFVLTCNDKWRIDENMRNRPGRIFYMIDFKGIEEGFIREYCSDNLKNTEHIDKICNIASLFNAFNFDSLKALVEEMNRYNEDPITALEMLNIKPEHSGDNDYAVTVNHAGVDITSDMLDSDTWNGNPMHASDNLYVSFRPVAGESRTNLCLSVDDIVDINFKAGTFSYVQGESKVRLTKKAASNFHWGAF